MTTSTPKRPALSASLGSERKIYLKLKQIFADDDKMPGTYAEWLERAEKMESEAKARFDIVERRPPGSLQVQRHEGC